MKISRNSWHYRAVDCFFSAFGISESLCLYFWQVVVSVILSVGIALMGVGVILSLLLLTVYPVAQLWLGTDPVTALSSGMWWCFLGLAFRQYLKEEDKLGKPLLEETEHESNSLLVQYLKAKKEKVCPTIEFE